MMPSYGNIQSWPGEAWDLWKEHGFRLVWIGWKMSLMLILWMWYTKDIERNLNFTMRVIFIWKGVLQDCFPQHLSNLQQSNVSAGSLTISASFFWTAAWETCFYRQAWEEEPPSPAPHSVQQNKWNWLGVKTGERDWLFCWGRQPANLYFHGIIGTDSSVRWKSPVYKFTESIYLFKTLCK